MGDENLRTKKCPTKIGRTWPDENRSSPEEVCIVYFLWLIGKASELCVFKYLAKNNCYPQISSCLFPLEMMQILQLKVDCHFWLCPHFCP